MNLMQFKLIQTTKQVRLKNALNTQRQQTPPLLYSIDIWPARNSRLKQPETNLYIARCASVLAWTLARRIIYSRPFCTESAICCTVDTTKMNPFSTYVFMS